MSTTVNSDTNKLLLAQILQKHPWASANSLQFQQLITQETNQIHRQRFQFHSDLTLMNKEVIKRITGIGKKVIAVEKKPVLPPRAPVSKNFESRLKEQQDNFLKLVNPSKPKEINFSDNVTVGAIPTMDNTLQQREKELREIMKDYKDNTAAKKWIENEKAKPSTDTITIEPKPTAPVKPDPLPSVTTQKRVTFQIEEEGSTISFLSKLKKKETTLPIIQEELPQTSMQKLTHLLENSIQLQQNTLAAVERLTKFLQNQFSQSSRPVANNL